MRGCGGFSTNREYVAPAFFAPNGIRLKVYKPHGVMNAKRGFAFRCTGIVWYAADASNVEKMVDPWSLSRLSVMFGSG